jgi:hypothetical protein
MSIEAMKQALEAFEALQSHGDIAILVTPEREFNFARISKELRQAIEQAEKQEPVSWVDLLKEASQIVRDKVVWKRFIDGTPLANDIACWMADFAIQHAQQPKREPLTDEQIEDLYFDGFSISKLKQFARAIEAAHGIKENT